MQPYIVPQLELRPPHYLPLLGCVAAALAVFLMCLLPVFFVNVMQTALDKLHLPGPVAGLAVLAILIGSMINLPVYRMPRDETQPEIVMGLVYFGMMAPQFRRVRQETVVAVNVGGCVVPALLAAWQIRYLLQAGGQTALALLAVCALSIIVCWRVARPVAGIGIMMPAFIAPLAAVGGTWLACSLWPGVGAENLAPIAFTAGVAGPIVGADLFHLKDLLRTPVGVMSIGGAGTFDGIVLSGVLAALLA